MTQSIIGKTCPYCQFPMKQDSEVVVCAECRIPHHRECWAENGGCTTFDHQGLRRYACHSIKTNKYYFTKKLLLVSLGFLLALLALFRIWSGNNEVNFDEEVVYGKSAFTIGTVNALFKPDIVLPDSDEWLGIDNINSIGFKNLDIVRMLVINSRGNLVEIPLKANNEKPTDRFINLFRSSVNVVSGNISVLDLPDPFQIVIYILDEGLPVEGDLEAEIIIESAEQRAFKNHNSNYESLITLFFSLAPPASEQELLIRVLNVSIEDWQPMRLIIPAIDLDLDVIGEVSVFDLEMLELGPVHFNDLRGMGLNVPGALPGTNQVNVGISGHRGGRGSFFLDIDQLSTDDVIIIEVGNYRFEYVYEWTIIVDRYDWSYLEPTAYPVVTLQTCEPKYVKDPELRMLVRGKLEDVFLIDSSPLLPEQANQYKGLLTR